jgi:hypothetical protein
MAKNPMDKLKNATHAYIGRKACGCVVAVSVDTMDKETGKSVAEFITDGLTIERVQMRTPEYSEIVSNLGCKCEDKKEPVQNEQMVLDL